MIKADFIIDDAIHNLIGGCQRHKILMAMPHNENIDLKSDITYRANNWKSAYQFIRSNNEETL